jgi:hypothetical protein
VCLLWFPTFEKHPISRHEPELFHRAQECAVRQEDFVGDFTGKVLKVQVMKFAFAFFQIAQNHVQFNIILQVLFLPIILNMLDILYVMRWAGHVARMGKRRGAYRVLVGKPEGRRPLGRPRRRWEDNIKTDLREAGCACVDWIGLAQDRDRWRALVSAVMNLRVP